MSDRRSQRRQSRRRSRKHRGEEPTSLLVDVDYVDIDPFDILESHFIELEKRIRGDENYDLAEAAELVRMRKRHELEKEEQLSVSYESIKSMFDKITQLGPFMSAHPGDPTGEASHEVRKVLAAECELQKLFDYLNKLQEARDHMPAEPLKTVPYLFDKLDDVTDKIISLEGQHKGVDLKTKSILENFTLAMKTVNRALGLFLAFVDEIKDKDEYPPDYTGEIRPENRLEFRKNYRLELDMAKLENEINGNDVPPYKGYADGPVPYKGYADGAVPYKGYADGPVPYKGYADGPVPYKGYADGAVPYKGYADGLGPFKGYASEVVPYKGFADRVVPYKGYADGVVPYKGYADGVVPYKGYADRVVPYKGYADGVGSYKGYTDGVVPYKGYADGVGPYKGYAYELQYKGYAQEVPYKGFTHELHYKGYAQEVPHKGCTHELQYKGYAHELHYKGSTHELHFKGYTHDLQCKGCAHKLPHKGKRNKDVKHKGDGNKEVAQQKDDENTEVVKPKGDGNNEVVQHEDGGNNEGGENNDVQEKGNEGVQNEI